MELVSMGSPPPVAIDVIWMIIYTSVSGFIVILLGVIAFFLIRLVKKVDDMGREIGEAITKGAVMETELKDHINNTAIHCNYPICGRRTADAIGVER